MRRREFVLGAGVAMAWPQVARAQQAGGPPLIGMLWANPAEAEARIGLVAEVHAGPRDLGYVDGETIRIEERFSDGTTQRLDALAAELVRLNVALIVTGATGAPAAWRATKSVPIVTASTADPVAEGLAASPAHPGGNLTGNAVFLPEIMAKRLERLKQAAPSLLRAGVLAPPTDPIAHLFVEAMNGAAKPLGMEVALVDAFDAPSYERAFATAVQAGIGGFVVVDHPKLLGDFGLIAAQALKHRLPTIGAPLYARAGGLLGYGVDFPALFRHAAFFVDKILKGARPDDIPIEQAAKFQTIANLQTARAIGVELPPTLLTAADEVIE